MYLECNAKLGDQNVIDFTVDSSFDKRTKTAQVTLPRFKVVYDSNNLGKLVRREIPNEYIRGSRITLQAFYRDEFGNKKKEYKENFFVVRTEIARQSIIVHLEDNMFLLKGADSLINVHYLDPASGGSAAVNNRQGTKSNIIEFIKDKVEGLNKGLKVKVFPKGLQYNVQEYEFIDFTIGQCLSYLYENFLLTSFFIGNTLYIGRPYEGQSEVETSKLNTLTFLFEDGTQPILTHDLTFFDDTNNNVRVNAKNYRRDNKVDKITEDTSVGEVQREVDAVFYNLSFSDFQKSVTELLARNSIRGFEGSITTYGNIYEEFTEADSYGFVDIADTVKFTNIEYSNRVPDLNGDDPNQPPILDESEIEKVSRDTYMVISTQITYSSSGIRQNIGIGRKITD